MKVADKLDRQSRTSLNSGKSGLFTLELLALECQKSL